MFYKIFGRCIILYLVKQIILGVIVIGKPVDSDETGVKFYEQILHYLGTGVCSDIQFITNKNSLSCPESILQSKFVEPDDSKPQPVKCVCRYQYSQRFRIQPSKHRQVVIVIPELNNITKNNIFAFTAYNIIEPYKDYGEVDTVKGTNYTLWSTELVDGQPVIWYGGEQLPLFNETIVSNSNKYKINVTFLKDADGDKTEIDELVTWNTTDGRGECFDVVNTCPGKRPTHAKIWPHHKPEKLFPNLKLNAECNIKVISLTGEAKLDYKTPPCVNYPDCMTITIKPEAPENVILKAFEETPNTWEVHVNWSMPRYSVNRYNVTLRTNQNWTALEVGGDETEAVFNGVIGNTADMYNVSIYAILGNEAAHTCRRAVFPDRAEGSWPGEVREGGAGAGAGATVAAALLALLLILYYCSRRKRTVKLPDYPSVEKLPKAGSVERVGTLETEDRWEVRSDRLLLHEVIGEGAFGVVRRATLAHNDTNVAVKMLKDFPSQEEIRSFRSEMELMKSVGVHPHIVSLVGVCSGRRPLIIAEYCSRGNLLTYLRCAWDIMISKRHVKYYNNNVDTSDYRNDLFRCKLQMEDSKLVVNKLYELQDICDKELTSLDLLSFCRQIAMGMEFLAANRVVHRDLAARNILVTGDRTLKIADFGLSRDVYEENQYVQKGNGKMPIKWMALESLTRRIYTTQSDVWSFGVVVWEVATVGAAPYAGVPPARLPRLLRVGYRMPRPANCSHMLYEIMQSCWRSNPRERPTFSELHARLDELLNSASAHNYLSLEIEPLDNMPSPPHTPKHYRYIKMLIRGKRSNWSLGENYERPLKPLHNNHYTSPPESHIHHPPDNQVLNIPPL